MDGFHHCEQVRERETERGGGGCNQFRAAMAVMIWALVVAKIYFVLRISFHVHAMEANYNVEFTYCLLHLCIDLLHGLL